MLYIASMYKKEKEVYGYKSDENDQIKPSITNPSQPPILKIVQYARESYF